MPDVGHSTFVPHGGRPLPIAEALRALPLDAPPRSAWPAISPSVLANAGSRPSRRAARWPYAIATAAALALALLLPVPENAPSTDIAAAGDGASTVRPADLPALMQESARLERLIAAVDADPLQPADALVVGLAFEDQLAGLDADLAAAPPGSRDAAVLWQQRVDVISRYAELQSSRRLLASAGQSFETTLVALH